MMLAVLGQLKVRGYAMVCVPLALVCYFIASTPIAGEPTTSPAKLSEALFKTAFYAVIAALLVARPRWGTGAGTRGFSRAGRWCSLARSPTRSS